MNRVEMPVGRPYSTHTHTEPSIPQQITALFKEVTASLESLPESLRNGAERIVRGKVEEVRAMCYRDRSLYILGREKANSFASTLVELGSLDVNLPDPLCLEAMRELCHAPMELEEVRKRLNSYAQSVRIPQEKIDTFPEDFRNAISEKVTLFWEHLTGVLQDNAAEDHQELINQEISRWEEKKVKLEGMQKTINEMKEAIVDEVDLSFLISIALKSEKTDELKPSFLLKILGHHLRDWVEAPIHFAGWKSLNKEIPEIVECCRRIAETSGKILTSCRMLAQSNASLQEILEFFRFLLKTPEREQPFSLLPEQKEQIGVDTRGFPIYLKPWDQKELLISSLQYRNPNRYDTPSLKSDEGTLLNGTIQYSRSSCQGVRYQMEDTDLITTFTLADGTECPLFAVMDGHNSNLAPLFLKEALPSLVQMWVNAAIQEAGEEAGDFEAAIRNAMKVGMGLLNHILKLAIDPFLYNEGSTLIFSFIYRDRLFTVNVGDSLALSSSGHQLNEVADASSERYRKKIKKRGGSFDHEGRVDGMLCGSVFGDFRNDFVDAFADTHVVKLGKEKLRLLLCCDGVAETTHPVELIKLLRQGVNAEQMVRKAYRDGSTDNLSAIVVDISHHYPT